MACSSHTMEGPAAPVLGALEQGPLPGSDVFILTIPAPACVGKAIYPQVVNWAQGKHSSKVASVGKPGEAERVGNKEFQVIGPGPFLARISKVNFWVSPCPLTPVITSPLTPRKSPCLILG